MPRPWIDQGEIQMAGQQDERDPHQSVVQDDRSSETESCVTLAVPEQDPRDGEENREGGCYRGVELLTRVEAPLLCRIAAEPEPVVQIEPVEVVQGPAQSLSIAEEDDRKQSQGPRNRRVKMHVLHETTVSDSGQRREIQDESRAQ